MVVKLLTERGLALRGGNEVLGSSHNGNFLGCMELIAQFDLFLAKHFSDHGNAGRGNPSYISSTIVEEFVELMENQVRNTIIYEVKEDAYFSLSVDSTPDRSHLDQLTVIIRYVRNGEQVERVLIFFNQKVANVKTWQITALIS